MHQQQLALELLSGHDSICHHHLVDLESVSHLHVRKLRICAAGVLLQPRDRESDSEIDAYPVYKQEYQCRQSFQRDLKGLETWQLTRLAFLGADAGLVLGWNFLDIVLQSM